MNPFFNFLESRYRTGFQTDESLKTFVVAGRITPNEYKQITGKEYK